jgi:amino acid adenylation domain-containing protein
VSAPKGTLTADLRATIAEHKTEILKILSDTDFSRRLTPPPISRAPADAPAPLSFAQESLWFLDQLDPGNFVYNICRATRLTGPLDTSALERALNSLARRHEVLRTIFPSVGGRPAQVSARKSALTLRLVDLSQFSGIEREREAYRLVREEARKPFNLTEGPLLRTLLLRLGDKDHVFHLAIHHILSDAWSMAILFRDLWALYEAACTGRPATLPVLPIQYRDYAVWQREWLQGEILNSQLAYWKRQLGEKLPVLHLPTDRPRSPLSRFAGARLPLELPENLTAALNDLSSRERVTLFMTLLTAFKTLLYRYTGQEDIPVASPIANRSHAEVRELIGFFVNTLVLRTDLSGDPTFSRLLARVRDVCLEAYAHHDLPFEKLVQELQPERASSRNPLFQVMFILQNAPHSRPELSKLRVRRLDVETGTSKFDLTLALAERDGKLIGFLEYPTDLFDGPAIERMSGHFRTLLESVAADPDRPISALPLLTEAERSRLLIEWNDTDADYPRGSCVHELFEAQVERTPEAIALEFERSQMTYRELNVRAEQLAAYLRELGAGPEKLVGICLERSLEMIVGVLGILKAGGAYVPLDPTYPKERLSFILADTRASIVITKQRSVEALPRCNAKIVCLDVDSETIDRCEVLRRPRGVTPENLAYVIYTSGTTGDPKGVLISHRALCNHIAWTRRAIPLASTDAVLQKAALCFDASVWEIFAPLLSGARLVVARPEGERDSRYLVQLISEKQITILKLVPSLLRMLLAEEEFRNCASIRRVFCGGDVLSNALQEQFYAVLHAELYNLYGPTEACIDATSWRCQAKPGQTSVPIGRPIDNTEIYVVDRGLNIVPPGVPGELCIAGDGLARGYLNRPDLTSERFVPHPFATGRNTLLYRTGDLARYLPDGSLEFLGRSDHQVKIRGFRIELGDIEAALDKHPGVRESVVVARRPVKKEPDDSRYPADLHLVAYIVPRLEFPSVTELRDFLKRKLPEYMIPSSFILLEKLPLRNSGKIDRDALPLLDDTLPREGRVVSPRTEIEEIVRHAWIEVLNRETIGVHDNFFVLGGHSLLAAQIISRLRDGFNRSIPLRALFESPTCAGLSSRIEGIIRDGNGPAFPSVVPVERGASSSLSLNQEQLWNLERMFPGTHALNIPYVYRLGGTLDSNALERAFREIIRRHEIMRTVFGEENGSPAQFIKPVMGFELPVIDLSDSRRDQLAEPVSEIIAEERQRPFDLAAGPLFRTKLIRLSAIDHLWLLTIHHIIADQWSMRLLRGELAALYQAFSENRSSPLADPVIQFADFTRWERRLLAGGFFELQLEYWKKQLALPLSDLGFGGNNARNEFLDFRTGRRSIDFDDDLLAGLRALARQEDSTLFMVTIAALSVALYLYTGRQDIRIGTLVANRGRRETENMIGHFLNTVVLRAGIRPDATLREVLRDFRRLALDAHAHQELPFEYLARVLETERKLDRRSLFQVLCAYQKQDPEVALGGLTVAYWDRKQLGLDSNASITALDLVFSFRESSTKLTGSVNYKTSIFDDADMSDLLDLFHGSLRAMTFRPGCRVQDTCRTTVRN